MMISTRLAVIAMIGGLLTIGSGFSADPPKPAQPQSIDEPFHKELLQAAADYKGWGRVDDEMRWAPYLCRMPNPGRPSFSASKDEKTHGQKLYSLFARQRQEYFSLTKDKKVAAGQVVVKQSWVPEEITDSKEKPDKRTEFVKIIRTADPKSDSKTLHLHLDADHFYPYAWKGDKVFKASKQADLFIMLKLDPKTPGTDEGWVYGTVSPDGKKVTSAGKIESCMKCHQEAKGDRLFAYYK
jgi:hypothetical protein